MSTPILLLLIAAVIIIAALAITAWRLQQRVREQKQRLEEQRTLIEQKTADRQAFVLDSLRIISSNVIDEGLNLSEATIRCKVLIDALELNESERQNYQVLDIVYEKIQHFATHQARKELNKTERERQDLAREGIETDHQTALMSCFKRLRHIQLKG